MQAANIHYEPLNEIPKMTELRKCPKKYRISLHQGSESNFSSHFYLSEQIQHLNIQYEYKAMVSFSSANICLYKIFKHLHSDVGIALTNG